MRRHDEVTLMFGFSGWELIVVLLIVLVIFGPKRLKNLGGELGGAIKGFRKAVADEDGAAAKEASAVKDERVIDGQVANGDTAKQNSDSKV
ncbi:MAG: twin-arginine translocase TatA/TatE family subunit [Pseudomonadota bacterium]